jgi:serine/threonine protein phosphatase 1
MKSTVIAFGDIHGCLSAAQKAVKYAEDNALQAIFLGDYIDRGPQSIATLLFLRETSLRHTDWIFLLGNHDQMLLDLIQGNATINDVGGVLGMEFGYNQCSKSFAEWQALSIVEQDLLLTFLQQLSLFYETEAFIFCHAVLRDTCQTISEKSRDELIWNYSRNPEWLEKPFVHGHLPVKQPEQHGVGLNVNTSCGYGGVLTGALIGGNIRAFDFVSFAEDGG